MPVFLVAALLQRPFVLNNPIYVLERWHGKMLCVVTVFIAMFVNICLVLKQDSNGRCTPLQLSTDRRP